MSLIDSQHNTDGDGSNRFFAEHIHQATMHLGQSKLCFCRALRAIPGDRPRLKRVLESLTAGLQFAIDSAQRLGVSR